MTLQKPPAQIQREIDAHLAEMRDLERDASAGNMTSANLRSPITYDRIHADSMSVPEHRWVGKCKRCGSTHRVDGRVLHGYVGRRSDDVVRARDGRLSR